MKFEKVLDILIGIALAAVLFWVIFSTNNFKNNQEDKIIYVDGLEEEQVISLEQQSITYISGEREPAQFLLKKPTPT